MSSGSAFFNEWRRRLERTIELARAKGCSQCWLKLGEPASKAEMVEVERQLGRPLPPSLRRVLLEFAGSFETSWFLPEDAKPPKPLNIFCGTLSWDVARLPELNKGLRGWIQGVFPNPEDPYDRVWHGKVGFHEVGNGDYLAIDIGADADGPVVYLSHEDCEGHGHVLGPNFIDAIDRLTRLGCAGAEDWQWLPFTTSPTSGIDPEGENGPAWREWFGLP
jgi:hypothetical protein